MSKYKVGDIVFLPKELAREEPDDCYGVYLRNRKVRILDTPQKHTRYNYRVETLRSGDQDLVHEDEMISLDQMDNLDEIVKERNRNNRLAELEYYKKIGKPFSIGGVEF